MSFTEAMDIYSREHVPREVKATERLLQRLYTNAGAGLRGRALAYASGLTEAEFQQLRQVDPAVENVLGVAEAEDEAALVEVLREAALEKRDPKVALELLRHRHAWVARETVEVMNTVMVDARILDARRRAGISETDPADLTGVGEASVVVVPSAAATSVAAPPHHNQRSEEISLYDPHTS